MNKKEINEVVSIYNYLIRLAEGNIGNSIRMEWGKWTPTESILDILIARRDKVKGGALIHLKIKWGKLWR